MRKRVAASDDRDLPQLAAGPDESARIAGVGRTKIYEAIKAGELKSLKIGSRRLIRISALDAWLASHEGK